MEGDEELFLLLTADLRITRIMVLAGTLCVSTVSVQVASSCPLCNQPSQYIHSRYRRVIADVPCGSQRVSLHLEARKFLSYFKLSTKNLHRAASYTGAAFSSDDEAAAASRASRGAGCWWGNRIAARRQMLLPICPFYVSVGCLDATTGASCFAKPKLGDTQVLPHNWNG